MTRPTWILMATLAFLIAVYAAAVLVLLPDFGPPFLAEHRRRMPLPLVAHLIGGAAALALGPWQFNSRLRNGALNVHRWMGRGYVAAVVAGGLGGLALATASQEGFVTHVGFGTLAVLWITATAFAYRAIRGKDQVAHRRWMIRSYALTFAAVTLRIYLPLGQLAGIPFADAYQAVSWACWVPNLIVAEWIILRPRHTTTLAA